jgi:hypothetical protein
MADEKKEMPVNPDSPLTPDQRAEIAKPIEETPAAETPPQVANTETAKNPNPSQEATEIAEEKAAKTEELAKKAAEEPAKDKPARHAPTKAAPKAAPKSSKKGKK